MSSPSAAALIERLRDVYEQQEGVKLADEKLSGRLPISLSTFNRWKKKDTRSYTDLMSMLATAGWLNLNGEGASGPVAKPDPQAALLVGVAAVLQNQAEALRVLGVPEAQISRPEILREPRRARRGQRRG